MLLGILDGRVLPFSLLIPYSSGNIQLIRQHIPPSINQLSQHFSILAMRALAILDRLKADPNKAEEQRSSESEDGKTPEVSSEVRGSDDSSPERVAEDAQAGVQKIEATTSVWTKKALIVAYTM
jgi:hypothetical protein